ncbi:MAG TPA: 7-carboxy-7-deazaguanine synthase [Oceanospirillales bacterium]|nr:7-carboxy-7-deazaguanine synthase [Oceanospirillaceae bacterium]HBS41115.1 7-carboxy-7-deazaguanine synthase [Oceanospirillales bacterium]|tara:strand:+ start:978 stop:1664 length:687 start_codon:yes stop_codon:yes gene_type:complete
MAASYRVKEIFYTLQGEGAQAGRPAVFCRFSKCNLWNGREDGRENAVCQFCDTDFIGTDGHLGGVYTASDLVNIISTQWPDLSQGTPYVVCTGGEPALQLDDELVTTLHKAGFEIAIETNGTLPLPDGIDWICLSPKAGAEVVIDRCDELKLVFPQPLAMPERFTGFNATHYYLQPMADYAPVVIASDKLSGAKQSLSATTTRKTLDYCLQHPQWKLSIQTHKLLEIE